MGYGFFIVAGDKKSKSYCIDVGGNVNFLLSWSVKSYCTRRTLMYISSFVRWQDVHLKINSPLIYVFTHFKWALFQKSMIYIYTISRWHFLFKIWMRCLGLLSTRLVPTKKCSRYTSRCSWCGLGYASVAIQTQVLQGDRIRLPLNHFLRVVLTNIKTILFRQLRKLFNKS